jgi:hypothetical protein
MVIRGGIAAQPSLSARRRSSDSFAPTGHRPDMISSSGWLAGISLPRPCILPRFSGRTCPTKPRLLSSPQMVARYPLARPWRSWRSAPDSSRETCICETPISAAICAWVRLPYKHGAIMRRRRAGSAASSGRRLSRSSISSNRWSSVPMRRRVPGLCRCRRCRSPALTATRAMSRTPGRGPFRVSRRGQG